MEIENSRELSKRERFDNAKPYVVVGIPAFNEEKSIARVILQSQTFADTVIVCDDGSTDLTLKIAQKMGAVVIHHDRNFGYGSAIQSLLERAKDLNADILVTLDGDAQHDPEEIPKVIAPILEGISDIVVGSRLMHSSQSALMPWYRRAGVKFLTKLTNGQTSPVGVKDAQSGFRAYSRKSIEELIVFENGMGVSSEILINARKQHLRVCEVSVSCDYHNGLRTSTRHPVKHGASVMTTLVKLVIEDKPLRILGIPGIFCLAVGTIFGLWMLQIYSEAKHIVTNIALASIGFLLLGFFCLSTAITLYAIQRLAKKMD